ncbi:hypothetical protein [Hoeflea sp.]|uniref:hypothetical protein n=1 Tax=Hoeflea sp. TaxID=1940281 RepID=UPI003B023652
MAIESGEADQQLSEDEAPKKRRGRKKKQDEDAVALVETEPVSDEVVAAAVDVDVAAAEAIEQTGTDAEAETAARPGRRRGKASDTASSEPKLTSSVTEQAEEDSTDSKPKKAGWWQRRGFL